MSLPEGLDFLYRPVLQGAMQHWELWAEDHVDLLAFKLAHLALNAYAENGRRAEDAARARRA